MNSAPSTLAVRLKPFAVLLGVSKRHCCTDSPRERQSVKPALSKRAGAAFRPGRGGTGTAGSNVRSAAPAVDRVPHRSGGTLPLRVSQNFPRAGVEDAFSFTVEQGVRGLCREESESSIRSWLETVMLRQLLRQARRRQRVVAVSDAGIELELLAGGAPGPEQATAAASQAPRSCSRTRRMPRKRRRRPPSRSARQQRTFREPRRCGALVVSGQGGTADTQRRLRSSEVGPDVLFVAAPVVPRDAAFAPYSNAMTRLC